MCLWDTAVVSLADTLIKQPFKGNHDIMAVIPVLVIQPSPTLESLAQNQMPCTPGKQTGGYFQG